MIGVITLMLIVVFAGTTVALILAGQGLWMARWRRESGRSALQSWTSEGRRHVAVYGVRERPTGEAGTGRTRVPRAWARRGSHN